MAASFESGNQVQEFLAVVRRRLWLLVLPALYLGVLGTSVALFLPKKYKVDIEVNVLEARIDEPGRLNSNAQQSSTQRELENVDSHVKQHRRIREVIEELGWQDFQQQSQSEQKEYLERIVKNLDVTVRQKAKEAGSTFIELSYKDTDRDRAETFLNALAPRWLLEVSSADLEHQLQAKRELRGLVEEEDAKYRAAEEEITEIQKLHGITPAQPGVERQSGGDPVETLLREATGRLDALESEREGALAELESVRLAYEDEPPTIQQVIPPVAGGLETQLAKLRVQEVQIQQQMSGLKPGASKTWQVLERKLEQLAEERRLLEEETDGLESVYRDVPNPVREKLSAQVTLLEAKLSGLDSQIGRTARQVSDLDIEQKRRTDAMRELRELQDRAAQAKEKRAGHLAQLSQVEENIAILNGLGQPYQITRNAIADDQPTSPNVPLIIVGAILAGLAIGVGLTALLEFARPGFRTPSDAVRALSIPVLGVVDHISTRAERARSRWQHTLVAISTLLLLGGVAWVSWAWHEAPQLLGTNLAHALDELHESLK